MKKLMFLMLLFSIYLDGSMFRAPIRTAAGQQRVFEVMYKGPGGIAQVNKKIIFAPTKNLSSDLNVAEISKSFDCKTKMGKAFMEFFLGNLISPKDQSSTINNRQAMIKMLIDHPDILEKFDQLTTQSALHEADLMDLITKRFVLDPDGNPIKFIQQVGEPYSLYQGYQLAMKSMHVYKTVPFLANKFTNWWSLTKAQKAALVALSMVGMNLKGEFDFDVYNTAGAAYFLAVAGFGLYEHYAKALELRNSFYAINQLIKIAQNIEHVAVEHGVHNQFKISAIQSSAGKSLLENLQVDRYSEKESYFFMTPAVHSFMYEFYENDEELAPLYASIAEMDVYVAIAKKFIALQDSDHTMCFAEFLDNQKPSMQAQGFWNMLIPSDKVVVNDLFEDRNIILTGSNEGGKTTAIRAILQNILLAQTFGIAAASQLKMTQYDMIDSYLNVSDNILEGKSRFAVELKQAQDILTKIKALQPDQKFFFAFDELFTGTNGEDGAECAYRFIDNIASYSGIQFIYATHFNVLKTIGSANEACANYKIEPPLRDAQGRFIRDVKGQLQYPYRLSPGANDVNIAMDRARDAGIFA